MKTILILCLLVVVTSKISTDPTVLADLEGVQTAIEGLSVLLALGGMCRNIGENDGTPMDLTPTLKDKMKNDWMVYRSHIESETHVERFYWRHCISRCGR